MMQSAGIHVAIIMDGNGRWAAQRGWPRLKGHLAGAESVRRVVEAAPGEGISTLTLYAFSSDNWRRPPDEVRGLMRLLRRYLQSETGRCIREGVRLTALGRRDRIPPQLAAMLADAEGATAGGARLNLRLAIDYSSRDAIAGAARHGCLTREAFDRTLGPPVDLLIRTGGEQRLSDFLLCEAAYAELYFTPLAWPDFGAEELREAMASFRGRERRFGGLSRTVA
jgi:undecaprenyl diphosphate synthase